MRGDCMRMPPTTIHGTSATGFPTAIAFTTPTSTEARSTNTATTFPFCTSDSFQPALEGPDHFFRREPVRVAFRQHARGERLQPLGVLRWRTRLRAARTD